MICLQARLSRHSIRDGSDICVRAQRFRYNERQSLTSPRFAYAYSKAVERMYARTRPPRVVTGAAEAEMQTEVVTEALLFATECTRRACRYYEGGNTRCTENGRGRALPPRREARHRKELQIRKASRRQ